MEHQDLLNALKGKRLYWRDEDNENDGVIHYITTTTKEGEYILLFDDFANVTMDRLHVEELAERGYTCDEKYSYNLEEPPIEYIRKALVGRRLRWCRHYGWRVDVIKEVREYKEKDKVLFAMESGAVFAVTFLHAHELISQCNVCCDDYSLSLPPDEETTTTATAGVEWVYGDGIDWETRLWNVYKHLYLIDRNDTKTALEAARLMVENYRKATEGGV